MGYRATTAVAILACALLAVTGCDVTHAEWLTSPEKKTGKAANEASWDPCTQIDNDALVQAGVDPATRDNAIEDVHGVEGWKLCSWHNRDVDWDHTLGVWSTTYTTDDFQVDNQDKPYLVDVTDISVAGRSGIQYRKAYDFPNSVCYLGIPYSGGIVQATILNTAPTELKQDPCITVTQTVEVLASELPE